MATTSRKQIIQWEVIFTLINTLIVLVLAQRYSFSINLPDSVYSWFYYINLSFGHFSFLFLLLFAFVILPVSLLINHRNILIGFNVLLMTIVFTLIGVDTFVFDQYRFHISPFFIQMMLDAGDQIIGFSSLMWLMFSAFILFVALIQLYIAMLSLKYHDKLRTILKPKLFFSITFVMFITGQIIHAIADANYDHSITRLSQNYPVLPPATAKSFLIKQGWAKAGNDADIKVSKKSKQINYPMNPIDTSSSKAPYNILMIALDSWRFDTMSEDISPNIYKLSKKSLNFLQHHSGANSTRTGIFSLFYGLPGSYWHSFESNQISPVFIDTLLELDYQTAVYASAPLINPEFDRTVFNNIPDLAVKTEGKTAYQRDEKVIEKWLKWSDNHIKAHTDKPFFGFLFLDAIHAYQYPPTYPKVFQPANDSMNYFSLNKNTDVEPIMNFYKNLVHYSDNLVGKVLDDLEQKKLLDKTIVIITSDHGQELNDNGKNYWGHNSNFTRHQTQVPMIVHWPGRRTQSFQQITTHYDVIPTLLINALNINNSPVDYSIGRNLFDEKLDSLPGMVMSNFSKIGILDFENDSMMLKNSSGTVSYLDHAYNPVDRKPSGKVLKSAIDDMTRFYRSN